MPQRKVREKASCVLVFRCAEAPWPLPVPPERVAECIGELIDAGQCRAEQTYGECRRAVASTRGLDLEAAPAAAAFKDLLLRVLKRRI